jgi:hypothetical protein
MQSARKRIMRVVIVEESHNRVAWQSRTPMLWIEASLLVGAVSAGAVLWFSPSPVRWHVLGAVIFVLLVLAVLVAVTTAPQDRGYLERLPEGGTLIRARVWPFVGDRSVVQAELDSITGFEVETQVFEESADESYPQSRLWAETAGEDRYCLTDWAETASVRSLGVALAKAGRLSFDEPAMSV